MQLCDVRQRQRCVFFNMRKGARSSRRQRRLQPSAFRFRTEANYFETNASRTRYPEFRARGLFVGSGVIEAGCKAIIGYRLKASGMFWTVRGANNIIALRC